MTKALNDFDTILKLDLDTRRNDLKASAQASIADTQLNDALRRLHSATPFLVRQNRKQDEFKTLVFDMLVAQMKSAQRIGMTEAPDDL